MVFQNANKDLKQIIVDCDCGCDEEIHIKKYKDDISTEYYLTICNSVSSTKGIFRTLWHRLKYAVKILFGKDKHTCEIVMTEIDVRQLVNHLQEVLDENK